MNNTPTTNIPNTPNTPTWELALKAGEIEVGGRYVAKVSNRLVTVRVMSIDERHDVIRGQNVTRYLVQNELTGRTLTFRSAAKFRRVSV